MTTKKTRIRLGFNVLVYQEDSWWIAHCLEMDLPAEGASPLQALENLTGLMDFQITTALEGGNLASIFAPAPPELWRAYATATDFPFEHKPRHKTPVDRLDLDVRELAGAF